MNPFWARLIVLLLLLLFSHEARTQLSYPGYQQPQLYWKNRKPHAAYWQQDVAYTIKARIDEQQHRINGTEELVYYNNSPDTLYSVFFHLFQNAFIKGSYTHLLEKANKVKPLLGKNEAAGLGTVLDKLLVDGMPAQTELDNTILKVYLPEPLLPGRSVTFTMNFATYFDRGGTRRRMQMYDAWGFMHYNGCQWFPKICVYDAKFGWDTQQHLGKEFYGDFGTYDVSLDFAANYVVEATGILQNRQEVLPDSLRQKLDLKNFAHKPWNEPPSVIIPYRPEERKVWRFYAEHVHDFAFTADPSYRIGTTFWNNVECVAIAQEPHASGWQNGAALVADIIKTFSEEYGLYHYPKMVAADANDGMEYPMITMDGGRAPGYKGLLVHEIAHNWFYGMVGSNETYRAALDEGFTQFLTAEGLIKMGDALEPAPANRWLRRFSEPRRTKDVRVLLPYITDAATGNDYQLNTHSDDFHGALGHGGGYRLVYYKTASMLYNLQYVLGDSLFREAMRHYVRQWKFAHPYLEDFRQSIISFTHVDLNWFFDEWLETTKSIDYSIGRIKKIKGTDSFELSFTRKGTMQMPLDFTVQTGKNALKNYTIPNTWFSKTDAGTVLPRWIGWGKLNRTYRVHIEEPEGIRCVTLDTSQRLADRMMWNNARWRGWPAAGNIKLAWDAGFMPAADWKHYRLYLRPDIWYNAIDGLKPGLHINGSYLNTFFKWEGSVWFNSGLGVWDRFAERRPATGMERWINYTLRFETPLSIPFAQLTLSAQSLFLDGLWRHRLGLEWTVRPGKHLSITGQTQYRNGDRRYYALYPEEWSSTGSAKNTRLDARYRQSYRYRRGGGQYILSLSLPLLSEHFDYNYVQMEWVNSQVLHRLQLRTRLFARYGLGRSIPYESALFLAGAAPEDMMDNKYVRSQAFVPFSWTTFSPYEGNYFHYGGGLNMRGYSGYYALDSRSGKQYTAYKGRSGAALNMEIDFTDYVRWQPSCTKNWLGMALYAFADMGVIELNAVDTVAAALFYTQMQPAGILSDFRFDAGLGAAVTIKKWGVWNKAKPLTLRFDMPLLVNRTTLNLPQYLAPRWILGINRAF